MVFVAESHFRRPDAPARIAHEGLHIDDCGVVVDDGFALGADVVAVLQNAAKHHAGRVIDAQPERHLGRMPTHRHHQAAAAQERQTHRSVGAQAAPD